MTADLKEALHLAESAFVCLRDAVDRHSRHEALGISSKGKAFATLSDDAALSAAWRLADAGLILRRYLEAKGLRACGLTEATGRGAVLPRKAAAAAPLVLNCLPDGETLATLARRERLEGFDIAFSKAGPDETGTVDCLPTEAEFATIYGRADLGLTIPLHDVDLTNAGADSLALACRAAFAAIVAASRTTEIN